MAGKPIGNVCFTVGNPSAMNFYASSIYCECPIQLVEVFGVTIPNDVAQIRTHQHRFEHRRRK
jgi:hypothetical protein